ncbi:MAG: type I-E CRISPR-associated protein Cse2/CasB [Oscillospiraceae bacterium]|jgi:CRISPR system Cascade subunit CasB|nr:type I-E CRISPR-associated protein Cse2/CasB [Oscillospiraceae bacterium]
MDTESTRQEVKRAVAGVTTKAFNAPDASSTKALLAKLRRGAGKPPGEVPEIFELTLGNLSESANPQAENAVHIALTLFAVQQQGKRGNNGSVKFGRAVRQIATGETNAEVASDGVTKRFNTVLTAGSITELSVHVRGLVKQCKEAAGIDFVEFALDLYDWQFDKESIAQKWGREFWQLTKSTKIEGDNIQ